MHDVINGQRDNETDRRWQAVQNREQGNDDFVYAVLTTGIYCRSYCPSRRPNRDNVTFFSTPGEARQAGYRACKRCHPDRTVHAPDPNHDVILRACKALKADDGTLNLDTLAQRAGMSPFHFHRKFKAIVGTTPKAYAQEHRAQRLKDSLRRTDSTITDAIYNAGFGSSSRFYAQATSLLGMTATQFRNGGECTSILFAVGECSLGSVLVACTSIGICAISLGDSPDELLHDLQESFPNAQLIGGDASFEKLVAQVVGYIDQPAQTLHLPLDIQGTVFQQRVWAALKKIPPGKTVSYKELAQLIGAENAHRAVAGACASNKLAVAIPCHRVVRSDGKLSGYRWGIERKRTLLTMEKRTTGDDVGYGTK
ncbi:MAG: bifunctional DNA-binding transcriptional regulator/O6-methylguanine-DNA methyltransferase Ada [Granulosicoccus sp.]